MSNKLLFKLIGSLKWGC
uniref:Uncharacterized protein n=1 Tax=Rhizophora mucronata TaxID=61149 RepID=A0A2P2QM07_RHIMU